jgi:hypothetical protein
MASCGHPNSELTMLRWMMPFLIAMLAIPSTAEAAGPAGKAAARRAASQLPVGLPRPYYRFRTTVTRATPSPYGRAIYVAEPEVLFTPSVEYVPYDYNYDGPWHGGPYVGHWNRLPYACGAYGYC